MLRKLGKKITNNLGLKILAAFAAIALWIVVVNIDDPLKTKSYTTSVIPVNEDYITAQGKYYEWLDGNNTISFKVTALRSIIAKLSNADFSATADMEKIEVDEDGDYRVPVTITTSKYSSDDVSISPKQIYLDVALEDRGSCQKAINATTKGNVAAGCAIGKLEIVGSNVLKISGPLSIVSQIDSVSAVINVDGMSTDLMDSVVPVLYDADGNVINTDKLKLSLNTVTISAQILNTKDVALEFATTGEVADGYMVTGIEYNLDTVRIKGESAVLNPVNKIVIPEEVLNIEELTEDLETTVDITSYLPAGTSLVLTTDAKVEVRVKVEPIVTKRYTIPTESLKVERLSEAYKMKYAVDSIAVDVSGAESVVEGITAADLVGTIDMAEVGIGEHQVEVKLALDKENCWIVGLVKAPVEVFDEDADLSGDALESVESGRTELEKDEMDKIEDTNTETESTTEKTESEEDEKDNTDATVDEEAAESVLPEAEGTEMMPSEDNGAQ